MHVYKEHLWTMGECKHHLHLYDFPPLTPFRLTQGATASCHKSMWKDGDEQDDNSSPPLKPNTVHICDDM